MQVRGAPLIGVTAAYGLALALRDDPSDAASRGGKRDDLRRHGRPRSISPGRWTRCARTSSRLPRRRARRRRLRQGRRDCRRRCRDLRAIGAQRPRAHSRSARAQEAGRRSTSSPIAMPAGSRRSIGAPRPRRSTWRRTAGIAVHVYVDETRPRNQGASLTAWELGQHGVPHHPDRRQCRRPSDAARRASISSSSAPTAPPRQGDVCNKIGTYLKALAAKDNGVPFYVALPSLDHRFRDRRRRAGHPDRAAQRATRSTH